MRASRCGSGGQEFRVEHDGETLSLERGRLEGPDATIEAEPGPLAAVLWHGRDLGEAERSGAVAITGSRRTATRFLRRFPLPSEA